MDSLPIDQRLSVKGKEYTVGVFERASWGAYLVWFRKQLPNPLAVVAEAIDQFPESERPTLYRLALESSQHVYDIVSPSVVASFTTLPGMLQILKLGLLARNTLTDAEAMIVIEDAVQEHGYDLLANLMSKVLGLPSDEDELKKKVLTGGSQSTGIPSTAA